MARDDTYLQDRAHLAALSDAELETRFWELAQKVVDPLVELGRTHTSPSIERSVLMRLGCESPTCAAVVAGCEQRGLLGHVPVLEAARRLAAGDGWDLVEQKWGGAS